MTPNALDLFGVQIPAIAIVFTIAVIIVIVGLVRSSRNKNS